MHLITTIMKNINGSKIKSLTGITLLFAIFMILNGCNKSSTYGTTGMTGNKGGTGAGGPGTNEVFIQGMAFNPATITVTAGTMITWTNKDAIAHTVTSDVKLFDSGSVGPNATFSYTFASAGTYSYHCSIHPSMVASVTVN
jgi:plastocyanin